MILTMAVLVALAVFCSAVQGGMRERYKTVRRSSTPAFRILAVGFSEAGKTTLLAAMYHALCHGNRAGISLRAEGATRAALLQLCDLIRNPSTRIHATLETASYEFVVRAESETLPKTTVCKLIYHDYAGENGGNLLRPRLGEEPDPKFVKALGEADVLMGLLDGALIAELMSSGPNLRFERELADLLLLVTEAKQQTVHLVITKWDLLHPSYTLDEVVEQLRRFPQFVAFQNTPRPGRCRVIPVAALGTNGFTSRVGGVDVRDPDRDWRPEFVDVPLACTIPDVIDTQLRCLAATGGEKAGAVGKTVRWSQVSGLLIWFLQVLGLNITFRYVLGGNVDVSGLIGGGVNESFGRSADSGVDTGSVSGTSNRAALNTIRYFESVVDDFERGFPGSNV